MWGGVGGGGKVAIAHAPLRIRLALKPDGSFDLATTFALPANAVWRIAIAKTRLSSADPLIRHKTSRRDAYDAARAGFPREIADEVLLMNEHGELCEGTITTLFVPAADGSLLTPQLRCGLLAGVLRAELLEKGVARESVITPDVLRAAGRFFVGNSLRGLIAAELVSPV
ncbi:MAG: aminotransferase class IV [Phyllobacteriaceae bacterium]|nr:aminotransferase class IV [Phyllobacteriaceae bacterium]